MDLKQSKVLEFIPEADRASSVKDFQSEESLVEQALGVKYDVKSDRLVFRFASLTLKVGEDQKIAKRQVQSLVHSVHDPLGTLAPIILTLKKLAQSYTKYAWDHPIPK
jgi:hypothetical protein